MTTTDQVRETLETRIDPIIQRAIAQATRPYRRVVVWLGVGYGVFALLSVVQALTYWSAR